nr:Cof-type HAD-IIB family hydrolase [Clostridium caldaquaticum]
MYKLLCIDMDGTLLNSEGNVTERTLKAIKSAHKKGVIVTVCTGRIYTSAKYYAELIGVKAPIIALNGAYIREKDKNEVIYKSVLGKENCIKILNIAKKYGLYLHFNTPDVVITEKIIHSSEKYAKMNETMPKDKQIAIELVKNWNDTFEKYSDEILKCITIDDDKEKILKAKEELLKYEEFEVVSSWNNNFEVMCKGVSKGRAVEVLAGFYNINREEIMCIGDNENDISMLSYAGLGVAMGNGESFVKEIADFVTDTNDDDGVAKAIEKFILE